MNTIVKSIFLLGLTFITTIGTDLVNNPMTTSERHCVQELPNDSQSSIHDVFACIQHEWNCEQNDLYLAPNGRIELIRQRF